MSAPEKLLLSTIEVSEAYPALSHNWLGLARHKRIGPPHLKLGSQVRYFRPAIVAWLKSPEGQAKLARHKRRARKGGQR